MNMKKINYIVAAFLTVVAVNSCKTEKEQMAEHHFGNKLYLNTEEADEEILVKFGMGDVVRTFTIGLPMPAEKAVSGVIVADQAYVENFKTIFGEKDVVPLPYENCYIENPELTIAEGSTVSNTATVVFTKMSELNRDIMYVMPIVLKNVTDINVVPTKREVYFIFRGAALVNVVCDITGNRAGAKEWATPAEFTNMHQFTLECLVRQNELATGHIIHSVMGVEGHFLLRLGDAGLNPSQLQVATGSGNISNADMTLQLGRWTHIAVTYDEGHVLIYFDGVKVGEGNTNTKPVTFMAYGNNPGEGGSPSPRYFWVGYSYEAGRDLMGQLCEMRIWNYALSVEQINEPAHFYSVDPHSAGLLAYWKMDEGKGKVLKDSSPNGNDLALDGEASWVKVSLPETE